MLTCEAVLTETAFLLKREGSEADHLFELPQEELANGGAGALVHRYRNRPNVTGGCLFGETSDFTRTTKCLRWTPIFAFTACTGTKRSRC
jgi:hypothetical protein